MSQIMQALQTEETNWKPKLDALAKLQQITNNFCSFNSEFMISWLHRMKVLIGQQVIILEIIPILYGNFR
jgi:hypothetical protein